MVVTALLWAIFKAFAFLLIMAMGSIFALYGVVIRFVMGLEAYPSTVRRFAWMAWGVALIGIVCFVFAAAGLARLILP
ncbi:hypothetical protein WG907_05255 [Sphingobium sp. AN558]|uniref:hypothetical protein n=1 Tax=Sphingobium sp. AN558 TaxID=3133442 RepID=UPI0030BC0BB0